MELVVLSYAAGDRPPKRHAIDALAARLGSAPWSAAYVPDSSRDVAPVLQRLVDVAPEVASTSDLSGLIAAHVGGRVLAVSSPQAVRELAAEIYDVDRGVVPLPESGSLTRFRISRSGVRSVVCLNDTLHLAIADDDALPREDVQVS
ncbi:hypothetical protein ACIBQ0_36080 [Nocardia nova]|uniref:hypothetical protein n=1 Tax=Nocardia nova TaxID=37330 RepID=UPI00378BA153